KTIARVHGISFSGRLSNEANIHKLKNHYCGECNTHFAIFKKHKTLKEKKSKTQKKWRHASSCNNKSDPHFPPPPPNAELLHRIIDGYCKDSHPSNFEEAGCAVCGQLQKLQSMSNLNKADLNLNILKSEGMTRLERKNTFEDIQEIDGPIVDSKCDKICNSCEAAVLKGKMPAKALANGFWIGEVPDALRNLTFAEQMMIARIRHNRCLVRVSSGRAKMIANCIMFSNPTVKVYRCLPPSREELSEVLAFVFIGSVQPTEDDYKRTPMLVRRNKVADALEWLKLNHSDYYDLEISKENMESYPLAGVPVVVDYRQNNSDSNKIATAMSKFDNDIEDGTEEGICPFTVHGLTGEE
ncbi:hypothetical protein GALMADRAFT_37237, partial [Galerina marginata CBS 339.88]